jgi:HlyD family secretion protein
MRPFEPPRRALLAAGAIAIALASLVAVPILLEPGALASIIEASGQVSGVEVTLSSKVPGIAEVVAVREACSPPTCFRPM